MLRSKFLALFAASIFAASALAEPPTDEEKKLINKLMQQQDVVAVNNVAKAGDFVPDKDPNTLQVVFLTDPDAKPAISEDGEVVFLPPNVSVELQGMMTYEAFRRKAKRILAIKVPPPPSP